MHAHISNHSPHFVLLARLQNFAPTQPCIWTKRPTPQMSDWVFGNFGGACCSERTSTSALVAKDDTSEIAYSCQIIVCCHLHGCPLLRLFYALTLEITMSPKNAVKTVMLSTAAVSLPSASLLLLQAHDHAILGLVISYLIDEEY